MSQKRVTSGLLPDGESWELWLEDEDDLPTEDRFGLVLYVASQVIDLEAQEAKELSEGLREGMMFLALARQLGRLPTPSRLFPKDKPETPASVAKLSRHDQKKLKKAHVGPKAMERAAARASLGKRLGTAVVGLLADAALRSLDRDLWSETLEGWQTKNGKLELESGIAKSSGVVRPVAFNPDEILALAQKFKDNPTPFAIGELLGAVLDVTMTIEGQKPA